ncbi:uncharacterized protein [Littorina saxatilis]|uniref:Uncharacterized protein n=1 Tax=Littorina saxatilis TaxID=31220 RepID=A0AAN9APL9_9CAEN
MAHTVVPNFPENVGLIPRHVRVWCRNRRRRTDQNNQAPPREHGEPEVPEDSVAPRQPNRRRRSSQLVSVLRATGDGSGMDEAFYSSQVNALFDLDLYDSPGAESTSTSSGAVENRIDAELPPDESEEEYDDNDVEERSVKDGNSLGGADSVFMKVHSAPSIPASSSSLPQPSPVGSKLSVSGSVSRNVKSDGRTGSITSDITNKSLKSKAESIAGGSGGETPGSHRSESSTRMTTGAAENGAVARLASATTVSSTVAESPQTPVERTPSGHSAKQESAKKGKKS